MFPAGLFHVLWDASQPCGAFFHFDRCRSARGAARHSKAGVGSATSFDCPARAAAGRRVRVTARAFIRVEAARFRSQNEARGLPRGEASTRATLRVAISLPTARLRTINRESSARRPPLEAVQTPGWRAQRHRQGRRCKASRQAHLETQSGSPHGGRRHPLRTGLLLENRDLRSRAPPPPPAEGATSLLLRRLRGRLRKRTSPDGHCPRASEILFKRRTCV